MRDRLERALDWGSRGVKGWREGDGRGDGAFPKMPASAWVVVDVLQSVDCSV